ncbi:MAG TPA: hypothetical protein VGO58_08555 [Chitinophagaceae bacterium]|jgi:hypothetical protein|nr:hypothetical protein [Chitinophagaceae bacterium]
MVQQKKLTANAVTTKYLSGLEKPQLVDLLHKKTGLLLAAKNSKVRDAGYITILKHQVELIQDAIKELADS